MVNQDVLHEKRMFDNLIKLSAFALIVFGFIEIVRGPRSLFIGYDRGGHAKYEKIVDGNSKQDVTATLGEPRAVSEDFNLPQRKGFEHFFEAAENSSAVEYFQWMNGGNWYYCIGFDAAGAVVVKGEGHS